MNEPDNTDRAAWAENALNVFARETYRGRTFTTEVAEAPFGDCTTMIPDLIGDLLHLAHKHGWDVDQIVQQARGHFDFEIADEDGETCPDHRQPLERCPARCRIA